MTLAVKVIHDYPKNIIKEDTTIILRSIGVTDMRKRMITHIMMSICQKTQIWNEDGFKTVKRNIKDSLKKSSDTLKDNPNSVKPNYKDSWEKSKEKRNKSDIMMITIIKLPQEREMILISILTMI